MADIDPRVMALLDALLTSDARALGAIAIARIEAAEEGPADEADPESRDPFAAPAEEEPDDRARRQLDLADVAVKSVLKRELALLDRSTELAQTLGDLIPSTDELKDGFRIIVVPPPGARERATGALPDRIDLLSRDRRNALEQMLKAWLAAAEAARSGIESEGELGA